MLISGGTPKDDGVYVAYVDHDLGIPFAAKMFLVFANDMWRDPASGETYRREVYGWIGPLPALPI